MIPPLSINCRNCGKNVKLNDAWETRYGFYCCRDCVEKFDPTLTQTTMTSTKHCYVCGNDVTPFNSSLRPNEVGTYVRVCHSCIDRKAFPVTTLKPPPAPTILDEAARLTNGDRGAAYGPYDAEASDVSLGWDVIIRRNGGITTRLVPLMMIWLKIVREAHRHGRDNLVDIAGYAHLADTIAGKEDV